MKNTALFHGKFKHFHCAAVLLFELVAEFFDFREGFILLDGGRRGFQRLAVFGDGHRGLAVLHRDHHFIAADVIRPEVIHMLPHKLGFHRERQTGVVGISGGDGEILEGKLRRRAFAGPSLRAELLAFAGEILNEFVALQNVVGTLGGDNRQTQQQILVAFVVDGRFGGGNVHLAQRRVGEFPSAGVHVVVGGVFCRFVEFVKGLFPERFIRFLEPPAFHADNAEIFRDNVDPLRRIHRHFDKAVRLDLGSFHEFGKFFGAVSGCRPAYAQQMTERLLFADGNAIPVRSAAEGFTAECFQYFYQSFYAVYFVDSEYRFGKDRFTVAAFELHVEDFFNQP